MEVRIIVNGKKAGQEAFRRAVSRARAQLHNDISVRVTWEYGDVHRFVNESIDEGIPRLIIAGGDGSVNEAVDALMQHSHSTRPELAIIPMGTANDFATACAIPNNYYAALLFAVENNSVDIDVAKANDRYFINVASGGFGAQVTNDTPVELKNFLGGGAYTLTGLVQAINFKPYAGKLTTPLTRYETNMIVGAICNGRQAGGGQQLAPNAYLNDGLLDIVALLEFPISAVNQVITELKDNTIDGEYVMRLKSAWVEYECEHPGPLNLDGEPYPSRHIRFEVCANELRLVLGPDCPCIV
ncbi:lipid kinase YegS [Pseudoalteromonas sp. SSDWG2]|uniref:lipid kinase YegS n=1 Tax=Pseudoalteromonas sp. SSDWG2 TaxID=3139391 RepID=UPI003BA9999C